MYAHAASTVHVHTHILEFDVGKGRQVHKLMHA